jgi:hypothetical protein
MKYKNNRPIIHLTVTINKITYIVGTLSFFNKQFSYFFSYPVEASTTQFNLETQTFTSRIDHITFHTNCVHIRYCDRKLKPIEVFYYQNGPLILEQPILTPLYVESIYFDDIPCLMQLSDFSVWQGSKSQEILNLDIASEFSLIFILAPACHPTPAILNGLQFFDIYTNLSQSPRLGDLIDLNHRAGRINLWNNWDLVIITTPFVSKIMVPVSDKITTGFRLPNYKNVFAALTDLITQASVKKL